MIKNYVSPVGTLALGAADGALVMCDWIESRHHRRHVDALRRNYPDIADSKDDSGLIDLAIRQLDEYFSGARHSFELPLQPVGTPFQLTVWNHLLKIPYGEITTYSRLAHLCGNPRGVRAVAAACGANPVSIIIPCHRVIASDGSLRGYAGSLPSKAHLLQLEGAKSNEL